MLPHLGDEKAMPVVQRHGWGGPEDTSAPCFAAASAKPVRRCACGRDGPLGPLVAVLMLCLQLDWGRDRAWWGLATLE